MKSFCERYDKRSFFYLLTQVCVFLCFLLVILSTLSHAAWVGPQEVVKALWGSEPGQIGIEYGDMFDGFPRHFGVSKSGKIVIADDMNGVLHVFDSAGSFVRDMTRSAPWKGVSERIVVNGDCVVTKFVDVTHTFNIETGELVGVANKMGGASFVSDDCSKIIGGSAKTWKLYTPAGQILKSYSSEPLELGVLKSSKRKSDGNYLITIEYNDMTYAFKAPYDFAQYERDLIGNLYAYTQMGGGKTIHYHVDKFNKCGKVAGSLNLPLDDTSYSTPNKPGEEAEITINATYGEPVIALNGDIYCYKRTPDNYIILKWTWQDDTNPPANLPDPPSGLVITASATGLKLSWTISPQDPGCVTGYEIVRSEAAGGLYTTLTSPVKETVKYEDTTAEVGKTYYYKIRAAGGTGYSDYSNEAMGKR